ncbi:MAG TPA: hypothetical protein ENK18_08995 [Deltaproteobacteria bacterium]|nr:hypothetical protein [Deltaproteobacteria bacterium]
MPRSALVPLMILPMLFVGCNCNNNGNGQDFTFPGGGPPPSSIPPENFGSWLSFDTAPDGVRLTMAYHDLVLGGLGYATGVPNEDGTVSWAHERVDGYPDQTGLNLTEAGKYASQHTASDGTVWVAYQDSTLGSLKAAHRLGPGSWELFDVDPGGGAAGTWASLQLTEDNLPVIAHCDASSAEIRLSRFDGTSWSTSTLFTGSDEEYVDADGVPQTRPAGVAYTRLFLDGQKEYVAFRDEARRSLGFLEGSGGSFTHSVIDASGDVGAWPSIGKDGEDLVVAYHDVANQDLRLATLQGGEWSTQVVDDRDMRGADSEIFSLDGELAILYFDGYNSDILMAHREGSGWVSSVVGGEGKAVGFHNEITFASGKWWAGSYDFTNGTLFVQAL